MKKLLATLSIAALPVIGIAGVAHADDAGTPTHPLPNGLCVQPQSNPPLHVPCDSPAATTPYVKAPMLPANAEDPTHVFVLADGTCVHDRIAVPEQVPCHQASQDQTDPVPAPAARKVAHAKKTAPQPVEVAPVDVDWWALGS